MSTKSQLGQEVDSTTSQRRVWGKNVEEHNITNAELDKYRTAHTVFADRHVKAITEPHLPSVKKQQMELGKLEVVLFFI